MASLLSSWVQLPPEAIVVCHLYAPQGEPAAHATVLSATARTVAANYGQPNPVDGLLPVVDHARGRLAVFAVASRFKATQPGEDLKSLLFGGLVRCEQTSFDLDKLYNRFSPTSQAQPPRNEPLFVTPNLHRLYLLFLAALRARLLSDICVTSNGPLCVKLRDGFLILPHAADSEWAENWQPDRHPLVHCNLNLHWESSSRLILQPVFTTTSLAPLSPTTPSGTPILLLPHGIPAYILGTYSGPTAHIAQRFEDALRGVSPSTNVLAHGLVVCWIPVRPQNQTRQQQRRQQNTSTSSEVDERAAVLVWPMLLSMLALSVPPSTRSPAVPESIAPYLTTHSPRSASGLGPFSTQSLHRESSAASTSTAGKGMHAVVKQMADVPQAASSIAIFVEAVARERDRERERAKEERFRRTAAGSGQTTPMPLMLMTQQHGLRGSIPPDSAGGNEASPAFSAPHEVTASPVSAVGHWPTAMYGDPTSAQSEEKMEMYVDDLFGDNWAGSTAAAGPSQDTIMNIDVAPPPMNMDVDIGTFGMDDDDFSFWDAPKPAVVAPNPVEAAAHLGAAITDLGGTSENPVDVDMDLTMAAQPSMFDQASFLNAPSIGHDLFGPGTGFTPDYAGTPDASHSMTHPTTFGQMQMPSPAKTPGSSSQTAAAPLTSDLVFSDSTSKASRRRSDPFNAIPFAAQVHAVADAKYASAGKFAAYPLSPESQPSSPPLPSQVGRRRTWHRMASADHDSELVQQYLRATDPSIGVVKRLKAMHQPRIENKQSKPGTRDGPVRWLRDDEDWTDANQTEMAPEDTLPSPATSDDESDNESGGLDASADLHASEKEILDGGLDNSQIPEELLAGPLLLECNFAAATLSANTLPLLPSSGAMADQQQPVGAPTPVSPAAVGSEPEDMEAAVASIAREAACNSLWSLACRSVADTGGWKSASPSRDEIARGAECLRRLRYLDTRPGLDVSLDSSAHSTDSWLLTRLDEPQLSVEKGGSVVQVVPAAIRFWQRLALGPRAGPKNVEAFVIYEDASSVGSLLPAWLDSVGKAYSALELGTQIVGNGGQGFISLKWELFRKTLAHLVQELPARTAPTPSQHIVIYVIVPMSLINFTTMHLRTILGVSSGALKLPNAALDFDRMHIHLVPDPAVFDSSSYQVAHVARAVYDRIPRVALRHAARPFFRRGVAWKAQFDASAFTLARKPASMLVNLQYEWPVQHLDVLDKHTVLHVGYAVSRCGNWIFLSSVDERGERHCSSCWAWSTNYIGVGSGEQSPPPALPAVELVKQIWRRVLDVASQADVEWRVVITKWGIIDQPEYAAWKALLDTLDNNLCVNKEETLPQAHVSLTSVHVNLAFPMELSVPDVLPTLKPGGGRAAATADERPTPVSLISDATWRTFLLQPHPSHALPLVVDPDLVRSAPREWVLQDESTMETKTMTTLGTVPLAVVALVPELGAPATLQVHFWHQVELGSKLDMSVNEQLSNIAQNLRELAILESVRRPDYSGHGGLLPCHIAALESMREAVASVDSLEALSLS